jgi:hypothetical protein
MDGGNKKGMKRTAMKAAAARRAVAERTYTASAAARQTMARRAFACVAGVRRCFADAARREEGEGFIDVLVKMLIVVVVGAVLLTIMRTAIPQLFTDMIAKIRDVFEL